MPAEPPSDASHRLHDPYAASLTAQSRAAYLTMPADLDLEKEIRLIRLIVGRLSEDVLANHTHITRMIHLLCRAVVLQAKDLGHGGSGLEDLLQEAARHVLEDRTEAEDIDAVA